MDMHARRAAAALSVVVHSEKKRGFFSNTNGTRPMARRHREEGI